MKNTDTHTLTHMYYELRRLEHRRTMTDDGYGLWSDLTCRTPCRENHPL